MRNHLILLALLPILAFVNLGIFDKEMLKRDGEPILLELEPQDPRSLMQGDYMRLRYSLASEARLDWQQAIEQNGENVREIPPRGLLIVTLGEHKRAVFSRFYQKGESLAPNERLFAARFPTKRTSSDIEIEPQSFFFQEGHAALYAKARYGILKLGKNGEHLLIGLADETGTQISP
ncbi:GDYXXLXY domain-containing protein [uncultured Cohaesibacter sp.]|uniref:GDYXXLXY domain-containing protein n=1 Tax=uncultured Cohaesibacter sp. TaxID=1002546 RepID=UPI0029306DCF|nr:GDYXXLXY domain-containing protein [uncultured Cohaesibacter sp.]